MMDLTGQSIGRYHIVDKLGEGGMAVVYRAYDMRLEREVAVKFIRIDMMAPAMLGQILKRFEREAVALARVEHPNIVKIYDFGEFEGTPYLVMQYLGGGTLKQRMGKPMPYQAAARLLLPLAKGLEYAHRHNLVHRDIKPANVLMTVDGDPVLSDFGVAKILQSGEGQTLTPTGVGIGTPEYMAPEQGMGQAVDGRTDIYALGVMFYEMVTGRKPFIADTPLAVIMKHVHDPLPRPSLYVPSLPVEVENVLFKAMAKDPAERYQSMGEFSAALQAVTERTSTVLQPTLTAAPIVSATLPAQAAVPPTRTPISPSAGTRTAAGKAESSRRSAWIWLALGAILLGGFVLAGLLGIWWFFIRPTPQPAGVQITQQEPTIHTASGIERTAAPALVNTEAPGPLSTAAPEMGGKTETPALTSTPTAGFDASTASVFQLTVPPTSTPSSTCNQMAFVADVTVPDGSQFAPGVSFVKTWRVKNTGVCTWSAGYALVFDSGERMGGAESTPLGVSVAPGETVDISVELTAPTSPGTYQGYWLLRDANGQDFGTAGTASEPIFVTIVVSQP